MITLTHAGIWIPLERLASQNGLTLSGFARTSGLYPTTFNRSKWTGSGGRLCWPPTESIAKALTATNTGIEELAGLITAEERTCD